MKALLKKHYGIILLGIIFGLTIGLVINSYQSLQELKALEVKLGNQAEELTSLEASNDLLLSGSRDLHTLEYSTSVQKVRTPPPHPVVGIGIGFYPVIVTESDTVIMKVRIVRIMCGGPGDKAGLLVGDEVVFYNGYKMKFPGTPEGYQELLSAITSVASSDIGTEVLVMVRRDDSQGKMVEIYQRLIPTEKLAPLTEWKTDCTNSSTQEK